MDGHGAGDDADGAGACTVLPRGRNRRLFQFWMIGESKIVVRAENKHLLPVNSGVWS